MGQTLYHQNLSLFAAFGVCKLRG